MMLLVIFAPAESIDHLRKCMTKHYLCCGAQNGSLEPDG